MSVKAYIWYNPQEIISKTPTFIYSTYYILFLICECNSDKSVTIHTYTPAKNEWKTETHKNFSLPEIYQEHWKPIKVEGSTIEDIKKELFGNYFELFL